ncbi:MAG: hypothetical protein R3274_11260 [Desulfobacterales bacterium]|nr:hypothetical protein [Desulfobacterales bacterium]
MSIFTLLGIIFLAASIATFGYQGMTAFMDMGTSDDFEFKNIQVADMLGISTEEWVEGISSTYLQTAAETVLVMPFALFLLAVALLLFLIHAFTGKKRIRKQ